MEKRPADLSGGRSTERVHCQFHQWRAQEKVAGGRVRVAKSCGVMEGLRHFSLQVMTGQVAEVAAAEHVLGKFILAVYRTHKLSLSAGTLIFHLGIQ